MNGHLSDRFFIDVFLHEVKEQAAFALDAASLIQSQSVQNHRLWREVHSMVCALANVGRLLWPKAQGDQERGRRLRDLLHVTDDKLTNWKLRNHFEHFDERLDDFFRRKPVNYYNRLAGNMPFESMFGGMEIADVLFFLNTDTMTVYFTGDVFPLGDSLRECERLKKTIEARQFFPAEASPLATLARDDSVRY